MAPTRPSPSPTPSEAPTDVPNAIEGVPSRKAAPPARKYSTNPNTIRVRQRNARLTPYRQAVERAKSNDLKAVTQAWRERTMSESYIATPESRRQKILDDLEEEVMNRRRQKGIDYASKIQGLNVSILGEELAKEFAGVPRNANIPVTVPPMAPPGYNPYDPKPIPELMVIPKKKRSGDVGTDVVMTSKNLLNKTRKYKNKISFEDAEASDEEMEESDADDGSAHEKVNLADMSIDVDSSAIDEDDDRSARKVDRRPLASQVLAQSNASLKEELERKNAEIERNLAEIKRKDEELVRAKEFIASQGEMIKNLQNTKTPVFPDPPSGYPSRSLAFGDRPQGVPLPDFTPPGLSSAFTANARSDANVQLYGQNSPTGNYGGGVMNKFSQKPGQFPTLNQGLAAFNSPQLQNSQGPQQHNQTGDQMRALNGSPAPYSPHPLSMAAQQQKTRFHQEFENSLFRQDTPAGMTPFHMSRSDYDNNYASPITVREDDE